jgi:hypothetical protein
VIERSFPPGSSGGRITIPVNPLSAIVSQGWLSVSVDGIAHLDIWFQKNGSGISDYHVDIPQMERWQAPGGIPGGTEFITYHIVSATGPGSVLVELKAK